MKQPRADVETGPDQWTTQADWPAPTAAPVTLRPQKDGSLGLKASSGTGTYTDSEQSESAVVSDPTTAASYRLAYSTTPLTKDVRVSGTPQVNLRVKLDKPTANLGALLVDYGTDTRVNYLGGGEGVKTLTTEDCHGESTAVDDACYRQVATDTVTSDVNVVARGYVDAQNRNSLSRPSALRPGTYYQVRWNTLPQDYRFKAGHRLALVLIGTDGDVQSDKATGAAVTVDLAGSGITLPVVGGARGLGGLPAKPAAASAWQAPSHVVLPSPHRSFR
jgi:X-Pro dipeptidyl-peptidase